MEKTIRDDRWINVREVAKDEGTSVGACHAIYSDVLGMKVVAGKLIPELLNFMGYCLVKYIMNFKYKVKILKPVDLN